MAEGRRRPAASHVRAEAATYIDTASQSVDRLGLQSIGAVVSRSCIPHVLTFLRPDTSSHYCTYAPICRAASCEQFGYGPACNSAHPMNTSRVSTAKRGCGANAAFASYVPTDQLSLRFSEYTILFSFTGTPVHHTPATLEHESFCVCISFHMCSWYWI